MWELAQDCRADLFFTMRSVVRDSTANAINCQPEVLILRKLPGMKRLVEDPPKGGIFIRSEFLLAIKETIYIATLDSEDGVTYQPPASGSKVDEDDGIDDSQIGDIDGDVYTDNTVDDMPVDINMLLSLFQQPNARRPLRRSGIILLGHPGIGKLSFCVHRPHSDPTSLGKTLWLLLLLVLRLKAGLPTIWQNHSDNFYLFTEDGVIKFTIAHHSHANSDEYTALVPKETWCMIDSNKKLRTADQTPPTIYFTGDIITRRSCQMDRQCN